MVVGVVLDREGNPVASELWPGNTADVTALLPVVERIRSRFPVGQLCIVADRGMISGNTLTSLEKEKIPDLTSPSLSGGTVMPDQGSKTTYGAKTFFSVAIYLK